jgi:hypothetical protein
MRKSVVGTRLLATELRGARRVLFSLTTSTSEAVASDGCRRDLLHALGHPCVRRNRHSVSGASPFHPPLPWSGFVVGRGGRSGAPPPSASCWIGLAHPYQRHVIAFRYHQVIAADLSHFMRPFVRFPRGTNQRGWGQILLHRTESAPWQGESEKALRRFRKSSSRVHQSRWSSGQPEQLWSQPCLFPSPSSSPWKCGTATDKSKAPCSHHRTRCASERSCGPSSRRSNCTGARLLHPACLARPGGRMPKKSPLEQPQG